MWLSKEERILLRICYYAIHHARFHEANSNLDFKEYPANELIVIFDKQDYKKAKFLLHAPGKIQFDSDSVYSKNLAENMSIFMDKMYLLQNTLNLLGGRDFIKWDKVRENYRIKLSVESYDLAKKYSHWFTRSGLCWKEYKGHWLIVLIGAILGFLLGKFT